VDLAAGGPPCQPFSLGGKHGAHRDRRDMWPEAVRAVRELRPRAFLFENVRGLTRPAFKAYLVEGEVVLVAHRRRVARESRQRKFLGLRAILHHEGVKYIIPQHMVTDIFDH
jgi:site-specific DNA-cytosine methylase